MTLSVQSLQPLGRSLMLPIGIFSGVIAGGFYNRHSDMKLPDCLSSSVAGGSC